MSNHNKNTHDSLVDRVYNELLKRYNYRLKKEVEYQYGELDIARYDTHGNIIAYYEVKSNNTYRSYQKAKKQTKRFINYQKGTIDIEKMKQPTRGIYVSQSKLQGELEVERTV
jgi:Holliday junction resolvase-like predicted endonuclease